MKFICYRTANVTNRNSFSQLRFTVSIPRKASFAASGPNHLPGDPVFSAGTYVTNVTHIIKNALLNMVNKKESLSLLTCEVNVGCVAKMIQQRQISGHSLIHQKINVKKLRCKRNNLEEV